MRWLALSWMVLTLAAAGCGGGDEEVITAFGDFPTGDYCGTLVNARLGISGAFLGLNKVSEEAFDELVRKSPRELRADIGTLAQALATLEEKVGDVPDPLELNAALASLGPKKDAAEKHLDVWHDQHCTGGSEKDAQADATAAKPAAKPRADLTLLASETRRRRSGKYAVVYASAETENIGAVYWRAYGHELSRGYGLAACTSAEPIARTEIRKTELELVEPGGLYRLKLPFRHDCLITAYLEGRGTIRVEILGVRSSYGRGWAGGPLAVP